MAVVRLTSSFVRHARAPTGLAKVDFFDARQPGFMVEVRKSGGKTFYQRYRDARGRERQFKIGSASVLSVSQARVKARQVAAQALLGDDPQVRRRQLRAIPSLSAFIQAQYLPFAKDTKRSWKTDETVLRIHILPVLGNLAMDEVSTQAIAELLRKMRDEGYAAGTTNRVLVLLRFVYNLAIRWGVSGATDNPARGLKTQAETCCERFLSAEEANRLIDSLDADENQGAAKAIKLLLLTGARRNEITYARWEQIDWQRRTLTVPISKSGRPRIVALNAGAVELLRSIPQVQGNPYLFPSPVTGRPSPSLHFPWSRIKRRACLSALRLHDLRHSFASFLVNRGVSLYVVQNLLGHSQPRMTQRYAHLSPETLAQTADLIEDVLDRFGGSQLSPAATGAVPAATTILNPPLGRSSN